MLRLIPLAMLPALTVYLTRLRTVASDSPVAGADLKHAFLLSQPPSQLGLQAFATDIIYIYSDVQEVYNQMCDSEETNYTGCLI